MTETSDYTNNNYHIFSEIFGTERLPDTFPISLDTSATIRTPVHSSGNNNNMSTSTSTTGSDAERHVKFSSLMDFNDLLLEDITKDLMLNASNTDTLRDKTGTGTGTGLSSSDFSSSSASASSTAPTSTTTTVSHTGNTDSAQFVLSQETCIKNVADTQSLSSADMTSTSSPNGDRSNSTLSIPNRLPRDRNNNNNNNNNNTANGSQVHMSPTVVPLSPHSSSTVSDATKTKINTSTGTHTTTSAAGAVHSNSRSPLLSASSASNNNNSKMSNDSIMKTRAKTASSNGKKMPAKHDDSNDQRRITSDSKVNLSSPLSPSNRASGSGSRYFYYSGYWR